MSVLFAYFRNILVTVCPIGSHIWESTVAELNIEEGQPAVGRPSRPMLGGHLTISGSNRASEAASRSFFACSRGDAVTNTLK